MGLLDDYKQLLTNERQKSKLNGLLGQFGGDVDKGFSLDNARAAAEMTSMIPNPAGDAASGLLAIDDARKGDYLSAALNGIGVLPYIPALAGTFIGPKSATWNKEIADKAAGLLDAGVDPAKVWKEHLIGRMPDGALFSEIDDSGAMLKPVKWESPYDDVLEFKKADLSNVLSHDELLSNYPDLASSGVHLNTHINGLGSWHKASDSLGLGDYMQLAYDPSATIISNRSWLKDFNDPNSGLYFKNIVKDEVQNDGEPVRESVKYWRDVEKQKKSELDDALQGVLPSQAKSTILHELQHGIQDREGWARGGSTKAMGDELGKYSETKRKFEEAMRQALTSSDEIAASNAAQAMDYYGKILAKTPELRGLANPDHAYRRIAGEAQARATQDRMNMSMDERRANYPLQGGLLSDIPLEQLIYRYGDNGPAASIDVWHGSPHKFDAFDMSKIGTGEGAQAYGHGLYFAENPEVAKSYADALSKDYKIDDMLGGAINDKLKAKEAIQTFRDNPMFADEYSSALDMFKDSIGRIKSAKSITQEKNNLYKTSLEWPDAAREAADPLGPQHFLDWDKPLSEQPESVRQALVNSEYEYGKLLGGGKIFNTESPVKAGNAYEDLKRKLRPSGHVTTVMGDGSGNSKAAYQDIVSQHLKDLGIPGIRYLDGGSRDAGNGSYNYVVFDDQIPRIVERNGKPLKGLLGK